VEPPPRIVTEIEYVQPTKPIVPKSTPLVMRKIEFIIVTPDNVESVFAELSSDDKVIFGITDEGYEDMALNLTDLRAYIQQQQKIIGTYESQYE